MHERTRRSILDSLVDDDDVLAQLADKFLEDWPSRDELLDALAEATWIDLDEVLAKLPQRDLAYACRERDLSESGSKRALAERLCEDFEGEEGTEASSDEERIFIVHGHDEAMLLRIQQFLSKLGIEPIVLADEPNEGLTIIEKLMRDGERCNFAVVLLSPDDQLANGGFRARQNVIMELGLFLGAFGRGRVAVVNKGDVELPSDIHGVLYLPYSGFEIRLGRELRAAGFTVDLNRIA